MKQIYLLISLVSLLIISSCISLTNKDPRCYMDKPKEYGVCDAVDGVYYDSSLNKCVLLSGCKYGGEIPFALNERDLCIELCVE